MQSRPRSRLKKVESGPPRFNRLIGGEHQSSVFRYWGLISKVKHALCCPKVESALKSLTGEFCFAGEIASIPPRFPAKE